MNKAIEVIDNFNKERDWDQFHSIPNLAKSISIEANELLECFQWSDDYNRDEVLEELADVASYVLMMAKSLDVNLEDIIIDKYKKNALKYPVDKSNGNSLKYDKL